MNDRLCTQPLSATEEADAASLALRLNRVSVFARNRPIVREASIDIKRGHIFGLLGPSGAGKSTLLKCVNRLVDLQPGFRVSGSIQFDGMDLLSSKIDADHLRSRIGMLFQQPAVFPASISENVLFGAKRVRRIPRRDRAALVERYLRQAHLWAELKDRLKASAQALSVGQQQRLCLARTLAMEPEILLMDEPTSALDARSTEAIERLILELRGERTILLVTHNIEQARRVTDRIACMCVQDDAGCILESGCCDAVFANPKCQRLFELMEQE